MIGAKVFKEGKKLLPFSHSSRQDIQKLVEGVNEIFH
jgi:hypothetical protein